MSETGPQTRSIGIVSDGYRGRVLPRPPAGWTLSTFDARAGTADTPSLAFEDWKRTCAPALLLLDVEPEGAASWLVRIARDPTPVLLFAPAAACVEEYDRLVDLLEASGVQVQLALPISQHEPLMRLSATLHAARQRGRLTSCAVTLACGFGHEFRVALDDKRAFDALLERVMEVLAALQLGGMDISQPRVANTFSTNYYKAIELAFSDPLVPSLRCALVPGSHGDPRLRLRCSLGDAAPTMRDIAVPAGCEEVLGRACARLERGLPLEHSLGSQRTVFALACEVVDLYLYRNLVDVDAARKEQRRAGLPASGFHAGLAPAASKRSEVSYHVDLDFCLALMRPLTQTFRLLLVRVPAVHDDRERSHLCGPPLALAQLAAVARQAGVETDVIDLAPWGLRADLEPHAEVGLDALLRERVGPGHYDLIGLSIDDTRVWPLAQRLCQEVLRSRGARIVIGGRGVAPIDRHAFAASGAADYIVEGEGEVALLQLIRHLGAGESIDQVSGLWWRQWPAQRAPNPELLADFRFHPPPDYNGFALEQYPPPRTAFRVPFLSYMFIFGCQQRCAFCADDGRQKPRVRPAAQVVADLRHLRDTWGVRDFFFLNNMINPSRAYLLEFLAEMESADLGVQWSDCARPAAMGRAELQRMAAVGCLGLTWGVDSGSQRVLDLVEKHTQVSVARSLIREAYEVGIVNTVNVIVAMPHETDEDFEQTVAFLSDISPFVEAFNFQPYVFAPGSSLRNRPHTYGLRRKGQTYDELGGPTWREHSQRRQERTQRLRDFDRTRDRPATATAIQVARDPAMGGEPPG